MEKYYCGICNVELDPEELLEGCRCPYCQTEIPEAVEDEKKEKQEIGPEDVGRVEDRR
ncbi:hypothetical protein ES703_05133 [subsurface metagenome]